MKTIPRIVIYAMLAGPAASGLPLHAGQLYTDQENPTVVCSSWSAVSMAPMGQEFVPRYGSLDAVELFVSNSDSAAPYSAQVAINIREGAIDGPIAGSSSPKSLAYGFLGIARLDFPASVVLVPGHVYVIEIVADPAGGNVALGGGWMNSYAQGRAILAGEPVPSGDNTDLWFREGSRHRLR